LTCPKAASCVGSGRIGARAKARPTTIGSARKALTAGNHTGLGDALRLAPFRNFWIGFALSGIGDAMTKTALVWYVFERTGSPAAVGLLLLAYAGPVIAGGLVAGHVLDRFDRRKVMLLDSLVRGTVVASVPVARMRIIPRPLRGWSFALLQTLMQGSAPAFSAIGGALFGLLGLRSLIGLPSCDRPAGPRRQPRPRTRPRRRAGGPAGDLAAQSEPTGL
jgi:Major Facilitator Superfamily